jgi:cyclopropane-fatty-acyl-phospholipid synthase
MFGLSRSPLGSRALRTALSGLQAGRLDVRVPTGECYAFDGVEAGPSAHVTLRNWHAASELLQLNRGSVRQYLRDHWDSSDLGALLTVVELNRNAFGSMVGRSMPGRVAAALARQLQRNVHARYRLHNAFYQAWLDSSMAYSAALFEGDAQRSLEQAQVAKYELILRELSPRRGQRLLDMGCGWGGFALHAAARFGCRVDAVCMSHRQIEWGRARAEEAGLQHLVHFERRDLREVHAGYDFVVSIEAYEALGERSWAAYFSAIARCLHEGGQAFLQAAVADSELDAPVSSQSDFLRENIHPNAALASWDTLAAHAQRAKLQVISLTKSDDDSVRTLQHWRERFNCASSQLSTFGLDRRFQRLWQFYLAYCEAGYRAGRTRLVRAWLQRAPGWEN